MRDARRSHERRVSRSRGESRVGEKMGGSGGESCASGCGRRREKACEIPAHGRCMILSHPRKMMTMRSR